MLSKYDKFMKGVRVAYNILYAIILIDDARNEFRYEQERKEDSTD